ncbi:MAG: hypothetical protein QM722_08850 [Piscinibacter sp.]
MTHPTRRGFAFQLGALGAAIATTPAWSHDEDGLRAGMVFTSSNAPAGNELLVHAPAAGGSLVLVARAATQGLGTGAGLGSQGAVTLSGSGRHVFVVNAASHSVSTFELRDGTPTLRSVIDSGGLQPISVAEHEGLVYVLNAGGAGNVAGFRNVAGQLSPIAGSARGLSAAGGTAPAQVGFAEDGDVLVVTEKATNRIVSYPVRRDGTLGTMVVTPSSGATPFGFAVDRRDHLIVSEAPGSAASSYRFAERSATPILISASVPNTQGAACWVAVTPNGRLAFTGNAATSNVSSYRIDRGGRLTLAHAVAGSSGTGAGTTDLAVSTDGRRLFAVAPRSQQIVAFRIGGEGELDALGAATGLPVGFAGLAAN